MTHQGSASGRNDFNGSELSFVEKFSYGMGDFASNMSWGLVTSFLMFFYTDVYGLLPAVVGLLMLIARVWDGVNDPIMGLIMERTRSRYGRFRPYLLYAPVVMALANILTFSALPLGETGKIIYAYATYLCLIMAYTAVNVPYGALSTVMTQDHNERTSLNSYRMFASMFAGMVIGAVSLPLIHLFGGENMRKGFFVTAVVYSLLSIPLFWLVFKNCKEVIAPPEGQQLSIKDSFKSVVHNTPLMLVMLYGFLSLSTIFGRMGMLVFYCVYNLKRPDLVTVFMLVIGICVILGITMASAIAKRLGKRLSAIVGCVVGGIGLLIIFFSDYTNIPLIVFGSIIYGFGCFGAPLLWSMTADCIEYAEWKSGVRAEGSIYAVMSLMTKLASAFVASVGMFVIGAMGYVPKVEQTPLALTGINLMCNLAPALMFLLAGVPMLFYKIDKTFFNKIVAEIYDRRRKAEAV